MAFIHGHSSGINLCGNVADYGTIQLVCYSDRGTSGNPYASSAVSYTHLDVYKRQNMTRGELAVLVQELIREDWKEE